jgi:hypothetical protein
MKVYRLTILMLIGLLLASPGQSENRQSWSIDGGSLSLQLYAQLLQDLGIKHAGMTGKNGEVEFELSIGAQGNLEFLTSNGGFEKFVGGSLPVATALQLNWKAGALPISGLRLVPGDDMPPSLYLQDEQSRRWLRLQYGHYSVVKDRLEVEVMDVRLGPAFADSLGNPDLSGAFVGGARLVSQAKWQSRVPGTEEKGGIVNWPTEMGFSVDVAMLKMDRIDQIARSGGRVAVAPSAEFENIGNGDAPWFNIFTVPATETNCLDNGSGACEPYGTDQGGILVFAFYRLANGRLEQIGLSAAKHAFNSINFDTPASIPCRFIGSARVVWSGCEDVYSVLTNANQDFLAPRSEITAHTGEWARVGSIFDLDGDGMCDPAFDVGEFLGGRRCRVPVTNILDRRLHIGEGELEVEGARYFMDSWYVVRDDINIFNSMGYREVSPNFSTIWRFPATQGTTFQQGSILTEWVDDATVSANESSQLLNTLEGRARVAMRVEDLGGGRYRYRIAVMNYDLDRQFDSLSLNLPLGAQVTAAEHFDGDPDGDTSNSWPATISASELRWDAAPGDAIDWGVLHTFEFTSALPPINAPVTLGVAEAGPPESFDVTALGLLDDVIYFNGFESQ